MIKSEKKIFLDRSDTLNTAVDRLIKTSADKVILNIPKNSLLGETTHNFQVLKRESMTADKELVVESIDDHILELANLCGITAVNPVFKTRERAVSDILPRGSIVKQISDIKPAVEREPFLADKSHYLKSKKEDVSKSKITKPEIRHLKKEKAPRRFSFKRWIFILALFFLAFGIFEAATAILPRATIAITLKKAVVPFNENIEVISSAKQIDLTSPDKVILPGELLVANRNMEMTFPANGKVEVATKASGTLVVYNAYSSAKQPLVKNTRFESPDKKIFRLVNQVVVPGAQIVNGQIQPSKITVAVVADEPGDSYNIGPAAGWHIPGFTDPSLYKGFYAESLVPMVNGFLGEEAVPTDEDLNNAKIAIAQALENSLNSQMLVLLSSNLKLFDKAKSFKLLKEEVNNRIKPGEFQIFAEGEMRELIFDEEMFKEAIKMKATVSVPEEMGVKNFDVSYSEPLVDWTAGKMAFSAEGSVQFISNFDSEKFTKDILGKDESNLRSFVFSLPGLEKATIALWPFWVHKVPEKASKVKVTAD